MKHKGNVLERGTKIAWKIGTMLLGSQQNIFKWYKRKKTKSVHQKLLSNH